MSSDTTCYWDPSGAALAQTAAELRSPAPRGRSVRHTQPGLSQRFADQWSVWQPCSSSSSSRSSSSSGTAADGADAGVVGDALYLRLPLRLLQQQGMHSGSALAAAAAKQLGQSGRAMGLSIEDVRQQVGVTDKLLVALHALYRCSCTAYNGDSSSRQRQHWSPCGVCLFFSCFGLYPYMTRCALR
jgi:hypothetical protein